MKKIQILITTYNRPELLLQLLHDIKTESSGLDVSLLIIDDHSSKNYVPVKNYLLSHFPENHAFYQNRVNNGKKYYWKTISFAYMKLSAFDFDYFIQLPDDVRLIKGFFAKAISTFDAIQDENKVCLNILSENSRLMKPCWTSFIPYHVSFGKYDLVRTGWMDMCVIAGRRFLESLYYTIDPVNPRWSGNAQLSSGVGMQISRRLIAQGLGIYSVKRSLVIHDHHPSVMHPEHRTEVPLVSNHDLDRITASMATMPGREKSMEDAIRSIIDQVDELRIYANNIDRVPKKYRHKKIKWLLSGEYEGDLGDAGKFFQVEKIRGYHFTIDDDLIYPRDYVATMIEAIDRFQRRAVISLHGRIMPKGKVSSYYRGAINQYGCLRTVPRDVFAHIIGTGVLAYHTDTVRIPFSEFKASNMADIWFSKYCQEMDIPRVVLKHRSGWITESPALDQANTIYANNVDQDYYQTSIVNSIDWSSP